MDLGYQQLLEIHGLCPQTHTHTQRQTFKHTPTLRPLQTLGLSLAAWGLLGTAGPDGWQPHHRGQREGEDIVVWHCLGVEPVLGKKRDFSVFVWPLCQTGLWLEVPRQSISHHDPQT